MGPPPSSPLSPLLELLAEHVSAHQAFRFIASIWRNDRWFTNARFMQTHRWAAEEMLAAGADEAEVVEIPADGRTRCENWIMPRAFECRGARLEVLQPRYELLADWAQVPQCVVQWCGPTPPDGIVAPLVLDTALSADEPGAARGKIVLTARPGRDLRAAADRWRAAAIVSYFLPDAVADRERITCWTNAWSPAPGGWAARAGEREMPGFNLPPAVGQRLADRLAAGERIVLRAWADTELYDGVLPVSTAALRGTEPGREVLLLGHAAEVGADDNASGCAAMLEAMRVLAGLVRAGRLPRPRRTMRILLTSEIYGMLGFATRHDAIGRAMAGLHLDIVGDGPTPDRPILLFEQGPTNPTYANELIALIHESLPESLGGPGVLPFERKRHAGVADEMIGDPAFGVPCPWLARPTKTNPNYHSSGDTLDVISPTAMMHASVVSAAYLYFIASADDAAAAWLADELTARAGRRWAASPASDHERITNYRLKAEAARCEELAASETGRAAVAARVAAALPGFDQPLDDLADTPADADARRVVSRVKRGTLSFQAHDAALQAKWPYVNWDTKATSALYWADGRRNIAQLRRLAEAEWNAPVKCDLADLFADAAACGMVTLAEPPADR